MVSSRQSALDLLSNPYIPPPIRGKENRDGKSWRKTMAENRGKKSMRRHAVGLSQPLPGV
jgi:hypothetical protein